jgi:ABC-type Fe3+ transport system substrate-binding protein
MAVTYALASEMGYKAGANVNSIATGAAYTLAFGLMAEGTINTASGFDWSTWYTTNGATYPHVSQVLVDAATNLGAMYIINYDMSGFTNIQEAVARINTLYTLYISDLALLKLELQKDFIGRGGG